MEATNTSPSLQGRRVWVTGGGTGIGRSVALALAAEGARVVVSGRKKSSLEETVSLAGEGADVSFEALDVSDREAVFAAGKKVVDQLGGIDLLVNSAGMNTVKRTVAEIDPEDWDRVMQVNATGAFNSIRSVLPAMQGQGHGLVVNISSVAGKRAVPLGGVAYNASKFAMTALGTSVSLEEKENGIRVTNVYPGEVNTPILDQRPVPVSAEHKASILQPEDVAAAVLLVAKLPARAHIPELVIKPVGQDYA